MATFEYNALFPETGKYWWDHGVDKATAEVWIEKYEKFGPVLVVRTVSEWREVH